MNKTDTTKAFMSVALAATSTFTAAANVEYNPMNFMNAAMPTTPTTAAPVTTIAAVPTSLVVPVPATTTVQQDNGTACSIRDNILTVTMGEKGAFANQSISIFLQPQQGKRVVMIDETYVVYMEQNVDRFSQYSPEKGELNGYGAEMKIENGQTSIFINDPAYNMLEIKFSMGEANIVNGASVSSTHEYTEKARTKKHFVKSNAVIACEGTPSQFVYIEEDIKIADTQQPAR